MKSVSVRTSIVDMSTSTQDEFVTPPGLTPELMQWVRTQSAAGVPLPSLLQSMRKAGWAEHLARRALTLPEEGELPFPFVAATTSSELQIQTPASGVPEPDLKTDPCCIHAGDREVHVLTSMRHPGSWCSAICSRMKNARLSLPRPARMQRSLTVDNQSGGESINDDRTSNGMFFSVAKTS